MGFSEIYGMSEVHSNISLPKDMRETSNKQPNFTPKATKKKKEEEENKNPKISRRKEITKTRAEINIKERKEMIAKIRKKKKKTKIWFCEKLNKIEKLLAILIKKKRENTEINTNRNENGEIKTYNTERQKIIRDYDKQLYVNKMYNLEETDKFQENYNLPN